MVAALGQEPGEPGPLGQLRQCERTAGTKGRGAPGGPPALVHRPKEHRVDTRHRAGRPLARSRSLRAGSAAALMELGTSFLAMVGFAPSASPHHAKLNGSTDCGASLSRTASSWRNADGAGHHTSTPIAYKHSPTAPSQ